MCVAECFDFCFRYLCVLICDLLFLCVGVLIYLTYFCVLICEFDVCIFASSYPTQRASDAPDDLPVSIYYRYDV